MATTLNLSGVAAISGGVLNLNGTNSGMADIALLPGWRPRVAKRPRGVLGGKWHEDVVESIPLRVHGTTELECLTALEVLAAAMDQAQSWKGGAAVDAVICNYAIDGTTLGTPLKTAVLGTPMDAADILELPVPFNSYLQVFEVNPVTLPLERLGEWLGDEEEQTASALEVGNRLDVTFSENSKALAPVKLLFDFSVASGTPSQTVIEKMFILVGQTKDLHVFQPPASGAYSNVADSGNQARGGTVLRYTPANTLPVSTNISSMDSIFTPAPDADSYFVFANVRNSHATTDFEFWVVLTSQDVGSVVFAAQTPKKTIYGGDNTRQWVLLGMVRCPEEPVKISLTVQASAAAGTFDIDDVVILANRDTSNIIAVHEQGIPVGGDTVDMGYLIDHRLLNRPKPLAGVYSTTLNFTDPDFAPGGYSGNALIMHNSNALSALILANDSASNYWRWFDADVIRADLTATRRPAYLVPR